MLNAWLEYLPFKYEQLQDLASWLEQGSYGTAGDLTSGYYHMSLHPEHWEYAGFCWEGNTYVFTVPAFGLAPVPRWFTQLMQELFRVIRALGVRVLSMIDDYCTYASTYNQAALQCDTLVDLLGLLHLDLNPKKGQFTPAHVVQMLGMLVDSKEMVFRIPAGKQESFLVEAQELLAQAQTSRRALARIAGKVLSFRPAVDIAPVMARGLYHAMQASSVDLPEQRAAQPLAAEPQLPWRRGSGSGTLSLTGRSWPQRRCASA